MFSRALVVDDLAASRSWLRCALQQAFPAVEVVEAGSLGEAAERLDPLPDIALIDLGLPDGSGVQLIETLARRAPGCLSVVATVFDDDAHLFPALRAGAQGYVLKDQSHEVLADMLTGIADGRPPLSASVARRLLGHFRLDAAPAADQEGLTARETDVLRLVAKGLTLQETADALQLSRHTVSGYLKDVYRKLAVGTRAEATLEAARRGLIRP